MALEQFYGTGRRKSSTARVYMKPGSGTITINMRADDVYFGRQTSRMIIRQPFEVTETLDNSQVISRRKMKVHSSSTPRFNMNVISLQTAIKHTTLQIPIPGRSTTLLKFRNESAHDNHNRRSDGHRTITAGPLCVRPLCVRRAGRRGIVYPD